MLKKLKNRHKGETVWIIGKGKSLAKLKRSDIGEGPVIAIYEAIVPIEILGFPNSLYCLQKDGGSRKRSPLSLFSECDSRECDHCDGVVRPERATLILHSKESKYCFEDYSPRYLFALKEIGLERNEFSLVCAIKIAQLMGCVKFRFVSCDAHAIGSNEHFLPLFSSDYYDWIFDLQKKILPTYLEGIDYEWVTPS